MKLFELVLVLAVSALANGQVSIQPLDIIANEGQSAVFACSPFLSGSQPVLQIQRPGESTLTNLPNDDSRLSFVDSGGSRTYSYSDVQRDETGTLFSCTVATTQAQEAGTLTVNFPPMYADPEVQTVEEGSDITVSLTVLDSRPTNLTVGTLTRVGGAIVRGNTIFNTVSVSFVDVQRGDAGEYNLTSLNVAGEGSVTFTLNVLFPPTFTAGTGRLTKGIRPGGSITLSCAVEGDPTPVVTYTPPNPDPNNAVFANDLITIDSAVSNEGAILYTCIASNSIASDVMLTYSLYVSELPSVSGLNIELDGNTVTISWTFTDGGLRRDLLSFQLSFSSASETIEGTADVPNTGTTFTVSVQSLGVDLEPNTVYTLTLTVTSPVGTSTLLQQTFRTDTPMPPTSPEEKNDGSIIGGAVGGAVGGAIVLIVALIIIITVLKSQHAKHPQSLPQKKEAVVDLPLKSNAAYTTVSFSGHENAITLSQNIAYHTTERQDVNTYDYESIETARVVAPGNFTETPVYEPVL